VCVRERVCVRTCVTMYHKLVTYSGSQTVAHWWAVGELQVGPK